VCAAACTSCSARRISTQNLLHACHLQDWLRRKSLLKPADLLVAVEVRRRHAGCLPTRVLPALYHAADLCCMHAMPPSRCAPPCSCSPPPPPHPTHTHRTPGSQFAPAQTTSGRPTPRPPAARPAAWGRSALW
jgi:hypothetical protein